MAGKMEAATVAYLKALSGESEENQDLKNLFPFPDCSRVPHELMIERDGCGYWPVAECLRFGTIASIFKLEVTSQTSKSRTLNHPIQLEDGISVQVIQTAVDMTKWYSTLPLASCLTAMRRLGFDVRSGQVASDKGLDHSRHLRLSYQFYFLSDWNSGAILSYVPTYRLMN
jgi:hypothetical protein